MEEMYELLRTTDDSSQNPPVSSHNNLTTTLPPLDYQNLIFSSSAASACAFRDHRRNTVSTFGSEGEALQSSGAVSFTPEFHGGGSGADVIKAKIASHPSYPRLLQAFIDCQKVGAPPEITCLLEEIRRDNRDLRTRDGMSSCYGADPELDEFMEVYCDMLVKYKSDLAKPVDEANTFLSKMETQLNNLCTDEGAASSSEEEPSMAEAQEAQSSDHLDIKDRLLLKFGAHIGTLKLEFSKKKKKGKLPKEARQTLLDWWNVHYRWPYPTEADKIALAESTGLDQRQINNWFINQRKRHWKPSEHMHFTVMENTSA